MSRYGRSVTEALLTNYHTFHVKRRRCQKLSKGAIILTLVGYWTICSSLSTGEFEISYCVLNPEMRALGVTGLV